MQLGSQIVGDPRQRTINVQLPTSQRTRALEYIDDIVKSVKAKKSTTV